VGEEEQLRHGVEMVHVVWSRIPGEAQEMEASDHGRAQLLHAWGAPAEHRSAEQAQLIQQPIR